MKTVHLAPVLLVSFILAACGGGGGSSDMMTDRGIESAANGPPAASTPPPPRSSDGSAADGSNDQADAHSDIEPTDAGPALYVVLRRADEDADTESTSSGQPAVPDAPDDWANLEFETETILPPPPPPVSYSTQSNILTGTPPGMPGVHSRPNLKNLGQLGSRPDIQVARRYANLGHRTYTATGGGKADGKYGINVGDEWMTYPHNANNLTMAVHIKTTRSAFAHSSSQDPVKSGNTSTKGVVGLAKRDIESRGGTFDDFFTTNAWLQAPGSAVQPAAQGNELNATWTGKLIAYDSNPGSILVRGQALGGDATVTVRFRYHRTGGHPPPTVDVELDNILGVWTHLFEYPEQTWRGLALRNGSFSDNSGGRTIAGTFRNYGSTAGTNANTVGGVFETNTMKGGFVATHPGN